MCTDRESSLFGLRPEVVERRRIVFWMVYKTDVWEVRDVRSLLILHVNNRSESVHRSTWGIYLWDEFH
jgi:hypothetical protein